MGLEIYILGVGQADTIVIRTPRGKLIVIDAVDPKKIGAFLKNVNQQLDDSGRIEIAHLIVTHPHKDHYDGVQSLLDRNKYDVRNIILSPSRWFDSVCPPGYHTTLSFIDHDRTSVRYLSGYECVYPDEGTYYRPMHVKGKNKSVTATGTRAHQLCLELLGPSHSMLDTMRDSKGFNPNHLSIISRISYGNFSMVFSGDAQMENWAHYDDVGLLKDGCTILKAAHHGSRSGTQWERLERLAPKWVIVSSDPDKRHALPDTVGTMTFVEYIEKGKNMPSVLLTKETGTIGIIVDRPNARAPFLYRYNEKSHELVPPRKEAVLISKTKRDANDWRTLAERRFHRVR